MKLKGKVAVVTGASRGIGRSIAKLFAQEGAKVVINYNSSEGQALDLVEQLKKEGGEIIALKADVSKADDVKTMIRVAIERFGRIDVLVNNAGILIPARFLDSTEDMWERTLGVNLKGAYLCSKEVAPIMLHQKRGKIINISSNSGLAHSSAVTNTPYTVSKAGLIGLTRSLAVNLAPSVNVNAICPGWIETDMSIAEVKYDNRRNDVVNESLLKRTGRPEEIASAALFLASDDSDFVTGETLSVSGGRPIR